MLKKKLYLYANNNVRVPAHLNLGKEVFDSMVKNKDKTALIKEGTGSKITYGEVAQMTADVALWLTRVGVGKGEVVCICSEENLEYLPTVMGIICAGATVSPMDLTCEHFLLMDRLIVASPTIMFCSSSVYETHKQTFDDVGSIQHYILYGNETKDGAVLFKELLTGTTQLEEFEPVPVNGWEDVAFILFCSETTKRDRITHLRFLSDTQNLFATDSEDFNTYRDIYRSSYSFWYALAFLRANASGIYTSGLATAKMLRRRIK